MYNRSHCFFYVVVILTISSFTDGRLEFVKSSHGTRLLKFRRYTYGLQYQTGAKSRWHCSSHHSKGCKAGIWMIGNELVKTVNEHLHDPKGNEMDGPSPIYGQGLWCAASIYSGQYKTT